MAPKAMKRPAASAPSGGPAKSAKRADASAFKIIAKAVNDADLPESAREMLVGMMSSSLGIFKEDRHAYQTQVVEMTGATLRSVEAGLQANIKAAEEKVAGLDVEKTSRDATLSSAESTVTAKTEALTQQKQALSDAHEAHKIQKKALADAKEAETTGNAELGVAAGKKTKLEAGHKEMFTPLKEGTVPKNELKKATAALVALGKEFGFDQSMLGSITAAISKDPADRGSFDNMVLSSLEADFTKVLAALTDSLSNGEAGKAQRAAAVESAQKVCDAVADQYTSCTESLQTANTELKEAEAATKAAKKSVKEFQPEADGAAQDCESAKAALQDFQEGALTAFKELEARTAPQPEPAEEDEMVLKPDEAAAA